MEQSPLLTGKLAKCPHCGVSVQFAAPTKVGLTVFGPGKLRADILSLALVVNATKGSGPEDLLYAEAAMCPHCEKAVIALHHTAAKLTRYVWPEGITRKPIPTEVPDEIARDFSEACNVLRFSPKAAAALARRCLQAVLTGQGFTQHDLSKQIDAALATLPPYVADNVDAVRAIGNFAAHEIKSTASGTICEVEPEEAEWTLSVLEELFEHYYVQRADAARRRAELNAKLVAANRPPIKVPPKP